MSNQKREDVRLSDFLFWHLVAAILIIESGQVDGKSIGGKTMIHSQPCWDWGAGYKAQKSMKTIINMVLISIYGVKSIVTHKSFALFLYRKTFLLKKKNHLCLLPLSQFSLSSEEMSHLQTLYSHVPQTLYYKSVRVYSWKYFVLLSFIP